jgi:hypothetical protein
MDFNIKRDDIIKYLDKNYTIIDGEFVIRYYDDTEWGSDIIKSLCVIFSIENEYSKDILKSWSFSNGLDEEGFKEALRPRTLKVEFNIEATNDLMQYGLDVEQTLVTIISEQLAKEIDMTIINELIAIDKLNNTDELLSIIKCIGYGLDEQITYDPITYTPTKRFSSIKRKEIENERNNNPIWQDCF